MGTASGGPGIDTLTGNTGGAVGPDGSGNINVIGSGAISVTGSPGTNTLTIATSGGGLMWQSISASQTLAVNHGYFLVSPGGALSLALPASSASGDQIWLTLDGATSFTVTQASGQQIRFFSQTTTLGSGGSLSSTSVGNTLVLICQTANTKWNVFSSGGNITVV